MNVEELKLQLQQKLFESLGLEKSEEVADAVAETYNNYELHEKPIVVIDYLVGTSSKNLNTLKEALSLLRESTNNYLWVFGFKELYKVLAISSFFYYLIKDNLTYWHYAGLAVTLLDYLVQYVRSGETNE